MMAAPGGLRSLPFNRLLPSVLTVLALCAGLTSIRFALQDKWQAAVVAIILAALLDALDGRIARRFGGVTKFGAELDSLADFLSFGVAPAVTLYLWSLQRWGGFGWVIALVFAVCAALRLARFNTRLGETDLPSWAPNFFTGLPAPAAAARRWQVASAPARPPRFPSPGVCVAMKNVMGCAGAAGCPCARTAAEPNKVTAMAERIIRLFMMSRLLYAKNQSPNDPGVTEA